MQFYRILVVALLKYKKRVIGKNVLVKSLKPLDFTGFNKVISS